MKRIAALLAFAALAVVACYKTDGPPPKGNGDPTQPWEPWSPPSDVGPQRLGASLINAPRTSGAFLISTTTLTASTGQTLTIPPGLYRRIRLDLRLTAKGGTVTETVVSLTGLSGTYGTVGQVRSVAVPNPTNYSDAAQWMCNLTSAPSHLIADLEIAPGAFRGGRAISWKNGASAIDVLDWMHPDTSSTVTALVLAVQGGGNFTGTAELWGWP